MNPILSFQTEREWVTSIVEQIQKRIMLKVQDGQDFRLGLSGGSTPGKIYEELSKLSLPWNSVEVFVVDERMVPANHPASNQRMIRESFVSQLPVQLKKFVCFQTELSDQEMLLAYEGEMRTARLDLAMLGIGSDGHTASLFPHGPELNITDHLVAKSFAKDQEIQHRFTLTFPALECAAEVFFLVKGKEKKDILKKLESSDPDNPELPAARFFHRPTTHVFFSEE